METADLANRNAPWRAGALITACWERCQGARCRGVRWDLLPLSELLDIADCVGGVGLSVVFRLMAEDRAGSSGAGVMHSHPGLHIHFAVA